MLAFVQMPDFGKRDFLGLDRWEMPDLELEMRAVSETKRTEVIRRA